MQPSDARKANSLPHILSQGGPFLFICFVEAYDSLDPNGNITIKWDVMQWTPDGYVVSSTPTPIVSLFIFKFDLVTLADLSY
jgi:hypothetical protein